LISLEDSSGIIILPQADVSVTRTIPFTLSASLANSTTLPLDVITATVATTLDLDSTEPAYAVDRPTRFVTDLAPGDSVTVTWAVTPLVSAHGIPIWVAAISGDLFGLAGQPLVVNEPGTPPDLSIGGLCAPNTPSPGDAITLTAHVLGNTLQP
jgi:hypothetical protein